jgi:hypothetical protein
VTGSGLAPIFEPARRGAIRINWQRVICVDYVFDTIAGQSARRFASCLAISC